MSLPWLSLGPMLGGLLVLTLGARIAQHRFARVWLGGLSGSIVTAVLVTAAFLAHAAGPAHPLSAHLRWGAGLGLSLMVEGPVRIAMVVVPAIALPVIAWASGHEERSKGGASRAEQHRRLAHLLALLLAFMGAMQGLVLAADLLTLALCWELVGGLSWALVAHPFPHGANAAASFGFHTTRVPGLGLWLAAGAALASEGRLDFASLEAVARGPWGPVFAWSVVVAAAAKSAQVPFGPWLFRAMQGPTSASALLHSSTMVAAGAWLLIRLAEPLWIVPHVSAGLIALGLSTALAAGVVALGQPNAKRLLAASTSAQYGFMFAAIGAHAAGAALAHLIAHAAYKALLFLCAGEAISLAGTPLLSRMGGRRQGRGLWLASAVGALALAAVPPLGSAWSKDKVLAGLGHWAPALVPVALVASALSALYAGRYWTLAHGSEPDPPPLPSGQALERSRRDAPPAGVAERFGRAALALITCALGLVHVPRLAAHVSRALPGPLRSGPTFEAVLAALVVLLALSLSLWVHRRLRRTPARLRRWSEAWLGLLPALARLKALLLSLARVCARFDERVLDAAVERVPRALAGLSQLVARGLEPTFDQLARGSARVTVLLSRAAQGLDARGIDRLVTRGALALGRAARRVRTVQSGDLSGYYAVATGVTLCLVFILSLWS